MKYINITPIFKALAVLALAVFAMVMTGCGTIGAAKDQAKDAVVEVKQQLFNDAQDYYCNGAAIRDVREAHRTNELMDAYNKLCNAGRKVIE